MSNGTNSKVPEYANGRRVTSLRGLSVYKSWKFNCKYRIHPVENVVTPALFHQMKARRDAGKVC